MRLTVLGSGSAFSTCGCNAGYLVDGRVLVDCGAPVPALVRRAATSIHAITLILLTHFHADHSFTLPTILGARAFADVTSAGMLVIGGPVGTREYVSPPASATAMARTSAMRSMSRRSRVRRAAGRQRCSSCRLPRPEPCRGAQHGSVACVPRHRCQWRVDRISGDKRDVRRTPPVNCPDATSSSASAPAWDGPTPGGHLWSDEVAGLMVENPDALPAQPPGGATSPAGALVAHDMLSLEISSVAT